MYPEVTDAILVGFVRVNDGEQHKDPRKDAFGATFGIHYR